MKLYIDCDPGIDDAFALGYLLTRTDLDIVGIGSVVGNGALEKVNRNLQLIVSALRPDIKIFRGSAHPIIEKHELHDGFYHGEYAFGDFWQSDYYHANCQTIDNQMALVDFSGKSAVLELIELSRQYAGDLVVLAMGPLTNIALAQLLDPLVGTRIHKIVILGGTFQKLGNSDIYPGSEFNFSVDPEAVQIVLNRIQCPKVIYPTDAIGCPDINKQMFVQWETNEIFKVFVERSIDYVLSRYKENPFYDLYVAVVLLHPEVIVKSSTRNVTIELRSDLSRGNMIVDVNNSHSIEKVTNDNVRKKFSSIELIEEIDTNKLIEIITKF